MSAAAMRMNGESRKTEARIIAVAVRGCPSAENRGGVKGMGARKRQLRGGLYLSLLSNMAAGSLLQCCFALPFTSRRRAA